MAVIEAARWIFVMNAHTQSAPLTSWRNGALKGRARVPGDKSISIRALILGALAVGETRIGGLLEGEDVLNTAQVLRTLGARLEQLGGGQWRVHGVGVGGFSEPGQGQKLDFGNSGTGCRLLLGAVGGCPITATFDGDASLRTRPMRRILDPLERIGARTLSSTDGRLPLTLQGAHDPIPIVFESPVPSAQVKSAALLAGLAAPGETTVIEREATRDHTEKMLAHFGAQVRVEAAGEGRRITLTGQPELVPAPVVVPADPSSAAFPLVAALITPGSEVILDGVMMNPLRNGLLATLAEMGASIEQLAVRNEGGEEVADLLVRGGGALRGVEVPAARAPSMIDEYPVLAVAAAFTEGVTVMRGLKELRVKESDRLAATAALLRGNGVAVDIEGDDLIVRGRGRAPGGGLVTTHMDHRIAMAALVMGLASDKPVKIDDGAFIATSFPGFVELMRSLGADLR
jgi:3-phosphoshikimate 1-carboxyvinyltransferase